VHHTGVSDEAQHRARGSSAWKGALDIEISIVPSKNYGPIGIVQRKSKDAEEAENMYVDLQSVPIEGWMDEDGEQVTSAVIVSADAPIIVKKDGPLQKSMKVFERAWWASGHEDIDGTPYVTRSALENLLKADGNADRTIQNKMDVSYDDKLIGLLINAETIIVEQDGWTVNDLVFASSLMASR
jgi:hypothetical protein